MKTLRRVLEHIVTVRWLVPHTTHTYILQHPCFCYLLVLSIYRVLHRPHSWTTTNATSPSADITEVRYLGQREEEQWEIKALPPTASTTHCSCCCWCWTTNNSVGVAESVPWDINIYLSHLNLKVFPTIITLALSPFYCLSYEPEIRKNFIMPSARPLVVLLAAGIFGTSFGEQHRWRL